MGLALSMPRIRFALERWSDLGVNPMQRFSAWARWIATVILIPIFTAVAARFIWEQPGEAANTVLKFLLDLSEQTWLRVTALALGCFVAGLWLDWLLRKLDGSRAEERKALGTDMVNLGRQLRHLKYPVDRPRIMSCFTTATKFGLWVPDDRIFSILTDHLKSAIRENGSYMTPTKGVFDYVKLENMIKDYLTHVGTLLRDGHFREAKQYAVKSKADFAKAYKEHGLSST
jgi:hypothetical protein